MSFFFSKTALCVSLKREIFLLNKSYIMGGKISIASASMTDLSSVKLVYKFSYEYNSLEIWRLNDFLND